VQAQLQIPGATKVPLLVAALGPEMLKLTGKHADGTITWMTGPKTLASFTIPTLREAAKQAGKGDPVVVAGFPVLLTNKPAEAREKIGAQLQIYGTLPSYRAMLDREGLKGPADIALAGDEKYLRTEIARLRDIGVTDFDAAIAAVEEGAYERTLSFLATELGK
jgi:alkanesulfonate monooxygenase SsuD/methylene tetrahydromethanopterin reductase-like flavin-dependent oxidoreductase (luciferase family)